MTQARDRLLRAASTLFSQYGFAGMSMRLLSQQAGANNAAVVYHFGSKTGLYVAVLLLAADTLEADAERVAGWITSGLPAELPPPIEEAFRLLAREALDRRLPTTLEPRLAAKLPPEALRGLSRLAARFSLTALAAAVAGRAVAEPLERLLQMWSAGFGDSAPSRVSRPRRGGGTRWT